jgi:hypothetical protein
MQTRKPFKEGWKNYLQQLKDDYYRINTPAAYAANGGAERGKWDDTTANGLTRAIIEFLKYSGGWATRINVVGIERTNQYGEKFKTPSTTEKGTPDIMGVYSSYFLGIEVKIGVDRQSDDQKHVERQIKKADGFYIIARNFPDFVKDFNYVKKIAEESNRKNTTVGETT